MSEETKDQAQQTDGSAKLPQGATREDGTIREGFVAGVWQQFQAAQAEKDELKRQFADLQAKIEADAQAKEQAKLESEGKYQEALEAAKAAADKRIAEADAQIAEMQRKATEAQLGAEIAKLGISGNPVIEAGIRSMFFSQSEVADPAEWAAGFAQSEHYQALLEGHKVGRPAPNPVAGADRAGGVPLADRLISSDQTVLREARAELSQLPQDKRLEISAHAAELARAGALRSRK